MRKDVKNKDSNVATAFVEDKVKVPMYKYHYKKWLKNGFIIEIKTK
jgi:hypothetical protein